jgi:hypothetical protein
MEPNNPTGTTATAEKNVQEELKDSVHRIWLAGLGWWTAAVTWSRRARSRWTR